jgi:hypothetical protein
MAAIIGVILRTAFDREVKASRSMFRFFLVYAVAGVIAAANLLAQSPAAAPSTASPGKPANTAAGSPASAVVSSSPSPSPSSEQLINSLTAADLQAAMSLLKANFTKPDAINETDLSRATLQGLMVSPAPRQSRWRRSMARFWRIISATCGLVR